MIGVCSFLIKKEWCIRYSNLSQTERQVFQKDTCDFYRLTEWKDFKREPKRAFNALSHIFSVKGKPLYLELNLKGDRYLSKISFIK
jgi:hypothetical protein